MAKITKKQYEKIAKALLKAGYTVDTVYEALEKSGFNVELKGKSYEGVYASRVIAIMHDKGKASAEPLKL